MGVDPTYKSIAQYGPTAVVPPNWPPWTMW